VKGHRSSAIVLKIKKEAKEKAFGSSFLVCFPFFFFFFFFLLAFIPHNKNENPKKGKEEREKEKRFDGYELFLVKNKMIRCFDRCTCTLARFLWVLFSGFCYFALLG
jgi:hypothetical protein